MKAIAVPVVLLVLFTAGCAHSPDPAASVPPVASTPARQEVMAPPVPAQLPAPPAERPVDPATRSAGDYGDIEITDEPGDAPKAGIADPLEPFNRAMYHFNDKFYFWLLKPVAQGYQKVVPEPARVSVGNFFSNLAFPIRFVNCLLQANFEGAATEFGRFTVNTLWGVGGLLDPASTGEINLSKQEEDLGQTLGVYGLGQGFFLNWPLLGPSSPRDTVGLVGDAFLSPLFYLNPWYAGAGIKAYDRVNDASLRIGDYESLKEASIDPYVAIRDAYVQYRLQKVNRRGGNTPGENSGTPGK